MAIGVEVHKGRVRISFKWEGKRVYETTDFKPTATGIKQAGRLRAEIVESIKYDRFNYAEYFPGSARAARGKASFYVVAQKYMAVSKGSKKSSTWKGYQKMINNYWLPIFQERQVANITAGDVRDAIAQNNLDSLSPKTFNNAMTPLRGIFELAMEYEYISLNPCRKVKAKKWQPPLPDPFEQHEIPLILNALRDDWRPYFQVAFGTGMRTGELLALRWSDIDWNSGVIKVERGYAAHTTDDTKTHKARFVELNDLSTAGLKAQKPMTFLADDLVFTVKGEQIVSDKPPRVALDAALKKAGIRRRKAYGTRHTFASIALSNGISPYEVSKQMGNSVAMLMRHYAKWIKRDDSGVATMFSASKVASKKSKSGRNLS